jgi:hypothetical protein
MKSKRLFKLQAGVMLALAACTLMAGYMFHAMPNGPIGSSIGLANTEIQSADLERLRGDLHLTVVSFSDFRHHANNLLLVCFAAIIGMIGFLGWSLFMIGRVRREGLVERAG